jgi:hypothetical protein
MFSKFRLFGFLGALFSVLFGGSLVFAQTAPTPASVTFTPLINFSTLFSGLLTTVAPIVGAALTVGLAIWGTMWLYRKAKSMAR